MPCILAKIVPKNQLFHNLIWAVEDDLASAIGETRYTNPDGSFKALYHNFYALRFDGHGKCTEFVEYFMELPERLHPKA